MQHELHHVAQALGWDGRLVPDVEVLGTRFTAVARIRPAVHEWRMHNGWPPELDPTWFKAWSEPERHSELPVSAVDLLGLLVPVVHAEQALQACGMLLTIAPCAVVLPANAGSDVLSLLELDYYGAGAVTSDTSGASLVIQPEDRAAEFGSSMFGRWLLEVLYSRLLDPEPEKA